MKQLWRIFSLIAGLLAGGIASGLPLQPNVEAFIHSQTARGFDAAELRRLFAQAEIQQPILDAMNKLAEAMPWPRYRAIFLTDERIDGGVKFWRENEAALRTVEREYGVPPEIIVAIIGVETKYGAHVGKYRVLDALSTLGFAYPKRSEFFLKELANYLQLCRNEGFEPLQQMGSYAGAMGLPQFMPSSFLGYAVDFDHDGKRDIWRNSGDAIASVANYFSKSQWRRGEAVAIPTYAQGAAFYKLLGRDLKPDVGAAQLRAAKVAIPRQLDERLRVKLLSFEKNAQENADGNAQGEELWLGLHNFYVITRYNHSPLYAMAVHQLSEAIAARYRAAG